MFRDRYPFFLAGEPVPANGDLVVSSKTDGRTWTRVAKASSEALDAALRKAGEARDALARLEPWRRRDALLHVRAGIESRAEEFARTIAAEAGKPIRDARTEVGRALDTFAIAAEEAVRLGGEVLALGTSPRAQGWHAVTARFPIGVCAFVTPFNFPLNLVAHKVAPAIAAGCPFVLKPASSTPVTALLLGELLSQCDLPPGSFSVMPMSHRTAAPLVEDERVAMLSFTGSPEVGWDMRARAGSKRVTLELGGNAACIVDEGTDLARAAERITKGAFGQAGQSCISVQRVFAHESLFDELAERLVVAAKSLIVGDPLDEATDVGPLIDEGEARRVEHWIAEAVERGARLLVGGERSGPFVRPAILSDVDPSLPISCREVFGPVAVLERFRDFDDALERVNASRYGLQAGVFTPRLDRVLAAFRRLEVGGVVVDDVPTMRHDAMPYGGTKRSGLGREGPRYAIEEMTELRTLVLRTG
jgi:acyl-CoA reductase-like NAD-dependent aldehyde dehydrogenase